MPTQRQSWSVENILPILSIFKIVLVDLHPPYIYIILYMKLSGLMEATPLARTWITVGLILV